MRLAVITLVATVFAVAPVFTQVPAPVPQAPASVPQEPTPIPEAPASVPQPAVNAVQAPAPVQHPYGLDPYNPSDAWLLRNYGAALVAQTPLLDLHKQLDAYNPNHAALLRQIGGAVPVWWSGGYLGGYSAFPGFAPLTPFPRSATQAERVNPADISQNIGGLPRNDRFPPANVDPERFRQFAASVPRVAPATPAKVCWIRMGDREITC